MNDNSLNPAHIELDPAVEEFIEQIGVMSQADGIPRIAGRILALLLVHDGPLSFEAIAATLEVSRGSVSANTRLLEGMRAIRRVSRKGERRDYFQVEDDHYTKLLMQTIDRLTSYRRLALNVLDRLPESQEEPRERLIEMAAFHETIRESAEEALERWRDSRHRKP